MLENIIIGRVKLSKIIVIICVCLAGILLVNTITRVDHQRLPVPREANINQIQGWMSVKYLANAYNLSELELANKLSLENVDKWDLPIAKIAKEQGISPLEMIIKVQNIIIDLNND